MLLFLLSILLFTHEPPQKCKFVDPANPIVLDSLTVLPQSITIQHAEKAAYTYNQVTGILSFADTGNLPDSIQICYQTLPYALNKPVANRTLAEYDSTALFKRNYTKEGTLGYQKEELFATDSLEKSGFISRGISFGNTQSVFVQSALNLQLNGKLADNLSIRASITDQQVPFQPEGNTQNIQEFDRVYVELYNDHHSLSAGDLVFRNNRPYFLKYLKNVQGVEYRSQPVEYLNGKGTTAVGIALAKGKFASITLNPVEGVSGPYKLQGPDGQAFVMVLANSEQVFLDGKLLKRGFGFDYVIDYNLGEITFNPGIVITRYSRIRVDYEYADQQYTRSILAANQNFEVGKLSLFGSFYQEKDNKNQPLMFQLNQEQKLFLRDAGDNSMEVYVPAVDSTAFREELILYEKMQRTDIEGNVFTAYQFSEDPQKAFFKLSFADVGQGNGNYVLKELRANGSIYEWIAPVNGQPQGRYEPIKSLTPPTLKNMLTVGSELAIDSYQKIITEVALSNADKNLYSPLDTEDNKGYAIRAAYQQLNRPLQFAARYKLNAGISYELVNKHFNPIDRFRSIEFDRNWGVRSQPGIRTTGFEDTIDDQLISLNASVVKDAFNSIGYKVARRDKGSMVSGWQQEGELNKSLGPFQLLSTGFLLHNQTDSYYSRWEQLHSDLYLKLPVVVPGYRFNLDKNRNTLPNSDFVISSAMNYTEHGFYIRSADSLKHNFRVEYSIREDKLPYLGELVNANHSNNIQLYYYKGVGQSKFKTQVAYRKSELLLDSLKNQHVEEIITGQINWLGNYFENSVKSNLIYTVGSGRELKRDYTYVPVATGEGTHTWRDNNGNGVQELDEFYEALNINEKRYIRILVPTNDFILAYTNSLDYRLMLQAPRTWYNASGMKRFLSDFSNNTSVQLEKKVTDNNFYQRFSPISLDIEEKNLLTLRSSYSTILFYNRTNPKWGLDGGFSNQSRKQLLTAGFESYRNQQRYMAGRYSIQRTWNFQLRVQQESNVNSSEYLKENQFKINSMRYEPEISWLPTMNFQLSLQGVIKNKENTVVKENAAIRELRLAARYSKLTNTTLSAQIRQVAIEFDGEKNTPAAYAMLEALGVGQNTLWSLNLQQRVLKGLHLNVVYDGMKPAGQQVVHTGRMMVRALF